jgi:hypothetical protein
MTDLGDLLIVFAYICVLIVGAGLFVMVAGAIMEWLGMRGIR